VEWLIVRRSVSWWKGVENAAVHLSDGPAITFLMNSVHRKKTPTFSLVSCTENNSQLYKGLPQKSKPLPNYQYRIKTCQ